MADKRYRGRPIFTIRLEPMLKKSLEAYARRQGCTASDIVRDLVEEELRSKGFMLKEEPIEGQVDMLANE